MHVPDAGLPRKSSSPPVDRVVTISELLPLRSWSLHRLKKAIGRSRRAGLLDVQDGQSLSLTAEGFAEASRLAHEHRLWELYMITHADIAPARVDQDADAIEHVLEPELITRLEALLQQERAVHGVAASPHPIEPGQASSVSTGESSAIHRPVSSGGEERITGRPDEGG
jgi:manganese/zinc/iron transport system permease protein